MATHIEDVSVTVKELEDARVTDVEEEQDSSFQSEPPRLAPSFEPGATYPWTRWVESLRLRRRGYQPETYVNGWFDGPSLERRDVASSLRENRPWDQVSGRSSSILGTVKTASMSVPPSVTSRSRANTLSSSHIPSRQSIESTHSSIFETMTHAAKLMAIRRRHVLREIYNSEAHYVHGLQTILQILSTYLTMRPAILRDLQRLYDMHDAFKAQLETISPQSAETWMDGIPNRKAAIMRKFQNQSLLTRNTKRRADAEIRKEGADPSEALIVAREIDKLTDKFDLYETFIRTFDVLAEDITILRRGHPADGFWIEGIEALQKSMNSSQRRKENHKKSMTMDDLIAKPVQRVCKYRLLLSELLKTIPETSYPWAYSEIKKILDKNVQAVDRINTVVGDPNLRIRIGKTTSLHERLDYGDQQTVLENVYQELGPLILCGVLHVAYHSLTGITGEYLVCVLFPSYFVLARPRSDSRKLTVIASIYLGDMTVDTLINGQGLACLDTPFSWKVIFQHAQTRYELVFSASSVLEERGWKTEILKASMMSPNEVPTISLEPRRFSVTCIPLKPLEADGRPLFLKRRGSIQTLSSGSPHQQEQLVLKIKRTHNPLHDSEVRLLHEAELTRSRSVANQTACTPTILMTPRSSRVKLERSIADIFTDDILPYPGMTLGRSDYLGSHQTIMRKSVMRGLSLRGVFSSRRTASLSKESQGEDDREVHLGIKEEEEMAVQGAPERDIVSLNSMRQRGGRRVSDGVPDEAGETRPKGKAWKRWLSMRSLFDSYNEQQQK